MDNRDRPLTVGQLRDALAQLSAEAHVYVQGYENGLADATLPQLVPVDRNYWTDSPYLGPHDIADPGENNPDEWGYLIEGAGR